jgi:hypothetical protein
MRQVLGGTVQVCQLRMVNERSKLETDCRVAYFETSYDAVFGVVYRPAFEARLRAQFEQGSAYEDEDASWYALRNTVYASGCRSVLAKDSSISFVEAQALAWSYFENALSVHTDILFNPTGLSAVQALTLMVGHLVDSIHYNS